MSTRWPTRSTAPAISSAPDAQTLIETFTALGFDRDAARGYRLDIAAGTAVRFEPGQTRTVQLVALGGERKVYGFRGLVQGALE